MKDTVFVVGHRNPDTDSICSAISYSYLKNKIGEYEYIPMRAGEISPETKFVIDTFGFNKPELLVDLRSQVKDVTYRTDMNIHEDTSIKNTWDILKDKKSSSLAVVNEEGKLVGVISVGDLAKSFLKVSDKELLGKAKTPVKNILSLIDGRLVLGDELAIISNGRVYVGYNSQSDISEDDIVILANDEEAQIEVLKKGIKCLVVCLGQDVSEEVVNLAKEKGAILITTVKDSFTVASLVGQSAPVSYFMRRDDIVSFSEEEFVSNVKPVVAEGQYRSYPVLKENGEVIGMLSRGNLLDVKKKKVIMVDHNERRQGVTGMGEAQVLEILDHHKIGNINTVYPIMFRNRTVGCSCTIIYTLYKENKVEIPKNIAGLMCSAILSDTLLFKSPTTTIVDKHAVEELAKIAGIDYEAHAMAMFKAGSDFGSKTVEEIFNLDFKKFQGGDIKYGVAQVSSVSRDELNEMKPNLREYMAELQEEDDDLDMLFLMLTDILNETTDLLCVGSGAEALARTAFKVDSDKELMLEKTVSRKKQIIPGLSSCM